MIGGGRAAAMAGRLEDTARRLGLDTAGRQLLAAAFEAAMAPRLRAGLDDHHPDFLHPARNALILMDDTGLSDPVALAAATLAESRAPALRVERQEVERLGRAVAEVAEEVLELGDQSEDMGVLERLVVATPSGRLVALADRLDHARHLHLREPPEWAPYHAITCAAFGPAAGRAHPLLERRFASWCRTFAKRYLGTG